MVVSVDGVCGCVGSYGVRAYVCGEEGKRHYLSNGEEINKFADEVFRVAKVESEVPTDVVGRACVRACE